MLAPSFKVLYNFEEIFEKATNDLLAAVIPSLMSRSAAQAREVESFCQFTLGPAVGPATKILGYRTISGKQVPIVEYERWHNCLLEIQFQGNRFHDAEPEGDDADIRTRLGEMRAITRDIMRQSQWPFHDGNLKYYRVSRLQPAGGSMGQIQGKEADAATLLYHVDFSIMPDAWPEVV